MQGWEIRQEIDDEKPYDESLQCVRHGNLRTICDSVMGPPTGFIDESLAPNCHSSRSPRHLRAVSLPGSLFTKLIAVPVGVTSRPLQATASRCSGDPFLSFVCHPQR